MVNDDEWYEKNKYSGSITINNGEIPKAIKIALTSILKSATKRWTNCGKSYKTGRLPTR
ncbi:MAG: hypothetical protein ACTSRK_01295 [Promethearchaeota archaeon]